MIESDGVTSLRRRLLAGFAAWLAILGVDLLVHGALLAEVYLQPSPFLLPPGLAFARIPIGYLSFLILVGLLVWLMVRLKTEGWRSGLVFSRSKEQPVQGGLRRAASPPGGRGP